MLPYACSCHAQPLPTVTGKIQELGSGELVSALLERWCEHTVRKTTRACALIQPAAILLPGCS